MVRAQVLDSTWRRGSGGLGATGEQGRLERAQRAPAPGAAA